MTIKARTMVILSNHSWKNIALSVRYLYIFIKQTSKQTTTNFVNKLESILPKCGAIRQGLNLDLEKGFTDLFLKSSKKTIIWS